MKDLQREIVNQVATGKITAEEGAARLESLESVETPGQARTAEPAPVGAASSATGPRRVRVASAIGSAEIVGDPSVAYAVAEGPHSARQDGDTMVIEQGPLHETDHFSFGRGDRRIFVNDFGHRKLKVRMNPDLALTVQVNAGQLRIEGVHGAITAGNLSASGRLERGASKVRCEMGNVTINLEKGSSVKVSARTTMGKVAVDSGSGEPVILGQSGKDVTVGSGVASLDIECTMGNVRVSA